MPETSRYEHGVPSWVDIGVHDLKEAVRFYAELFGWDVQDLGEEAGHYSIVSKGGKQVAAISPAQDPGPPRWTTYVNVDDVDEVAKIAESSGGSVIVAPMDVMTEGRMTIFQDTTGAFIAGVATTGSHRSPTRKRTWCVHLVGAFNERSGQVKDVLLGCLRLAMGRLERVRRGSGCGTDHRRIDAASIRHARRGS